MKLAESQEAVTYQSNKEQFDLGSDSDDEDGEQDVANVKMAYIDEKVAAICALGHFAVASPKTFGPYFEKTMNMLEANYNFFQEYVRIETVVCYKHLTEGMLKFHYGQLPTYKRGLVESRLDPKLEEFIQIELCSKF